MGYKDLLLAMDLEDVELLMHMKFGIPSRALIRVLCLNDQFLTGCVFAYICQCLALIYLEVYHCTRYEGLALQK